MLSSFLMLALTGPLLVAAQSWSMGFGNVTYQILFSKWQNPDGKTWTGAKCDQIMSKCDTRFICNVEAVSCDQVSGRRYSPKSWPGPVDMSAWRIVGKNKYEENSLTDFAYVNLTGVKAQNFCIVDVDPLSNDVIDEKIIILPGLSELPSLPQYEYDARFGLPIQGESISVLMPNYTRKGKVNLDAVQQHVMEVRVRAWGIDNSINPRRNSGSSVSGGSRYPDSSRSASPNFSRNLTGLHAGYDYATPYHRPASGGYDTSSSSGSSYPRQSLGGSNFNSSYTHTDRNRYIPDNQQTFTQVGTGRRPSDTVASDTNKDDMFQRRLRQ